MTCDVKPQSGYQRALAVFARWQCLFYNSRRSGRPYRAVLLTRCNGSVVMRRFRWRCDLRCCKAACFLLKYANGGKRNVIEKTLVLKWLPGFLFLFLLYAYWATAEAIILLTLAIISKHSYFHAKYETVRCLWHMKVLTLGDKSPPLNVGLFKAPKVSVIFRKLAQGQIKLFCKTLSDARKISMRRNPWSNFPNWLELRHSTKRSLKLVASRIHM